MVVAGKWKAAGGWTGQNVLLGSGGLDFEGDRLIARVVQAQDLRDFVGERAYVLWFVSMYW